MTTRIAKHIGEALALPSTLNDYLRENSLDGFPFPDRLRMLLGVAQKFPDWALHPELVFLSRDLAVPDVFERMTAQSKATYMTLLNKLYLTRRDPAAITDVCGAAKEDGTRCAKTTVGNGMLCREHYKTQGAIFFTSDFKKVAPIKVCSICAKPKAEHDATEPGALAVAHCRLCAAGAYEVCVAALPNANEREERQLYCCSVCDIQGKKPICLLIEPDADDAFATPIQPGMFTIPVDPTLVPVVSLRAADAPAAEVDGTGPNDVAADDLRAPAARAEAIAPLHSSDQQQVLSALLEGMHALARTVTQMAERQAAAVPAAATTAQLSARAASPSRLPSGQARASPPRSRARSPVMADRAPGTPFLARALRRGLGKACATSSEFTNGKRNCNEVGQEMCNPEHFLHPRYYEFVDYVCNVVVGERKKLSVILGSTPPLTERYQLERYWQRQLEYHWRLLHVTDAPEWFSEATPEGRARVLSITEVFYRYRCLMAHLRALESGAGSPDGVGATPWPEILASLHRIAKYRFYAEPTPLGDGFANAALTEQFDLIRAGVRPSFTDDLQAQLEAQTRADLFRAQYQHVPIQVQAQVPVPVPVAPPSAGPSTSATGAACKLCGSDRHSTRKHPEGVPITIPCFRCNKLHRRWGPGSTPCAGQPTAGSARPDKGKRKVTFDEEEG